MPEMEPEVDDEMKIRQPLVKQYHCNEQLVKRQREFYNSNEACGPSEKLDIKMPLAGVIDDSLRQNRHFLDSGSHGNTALLNNLKKNIIHNQCMNQHN